MSQKFQASVQNRGDVSYVKLGGVIDEDNELGELIERIPSGTAVIDLGEIERINSCGVRDWVNWLNKLENNGARSVLVECSPAIVAQINLVNNFTGNGVVKSFYVPYFCPECDEEKVLLVEASDMGPAPHEPPTCRCDECDLVMDFDDMPDSYFAFLSNQRKVAEPDKVNGAVRDFGGAVAQGDKKVRSRASAPVLSSPGKQASVPSLPSINRQHPASPSQQGMQSGSVRGPMIGSASGPQKQPSRPGAGISQPPQIGMNGMGQGASGSRPPSFSQANLSGPNQLPPGASLGFAAQGMPQMAQSVAPAPRSNGLVFALIGILVACIAVLAYLVLAK
jgi:anti-anti-sigma regulatory factor